MDLPKASRDEAAASSGAPYDDTDVLARLGETTADDPAAPLSALDGLAYDDSDIYQSVRDLRDLLSLLARFITRWDEERLIVASEQVHSIRYLSGNAYAFSANTGFATTVINLNANDYGRRGDLVAVRMVVGSQDLRFSAGAADAFHSADGPLTIPAVAGFQYIFHLVKPNADSVEGSYWVVHSTPATGSGTPGTGGGTTGEVRDPYEVDTAKRKAVVDAGVPILVESDEAYYGKEFVDEVYGPDKPAYYKCRPSAPAQTGGATVWKWFRSDIL
jgi:hypothetical protein